MDCKLYLGTRRLSQAWPVITVAAELLSCVRTHALNLDLDITEVIDHDPESSNDVLRRLNLREIPAVHILGSGSLLIGIYSPEYSASTYWHCIVECDLTHAEHLYGMAKSITEVDFLSLSVDEIPEFDVSAVTPGNFPWTDWLLLRGAVRDAGGRWVEKTGPRWVERSGQ